jgi:hypothetical protein
MTSLPLVQECECDLQGVLEWERNVYQENQITTPTDAEGL